MGHEALFSQTGVDIVTGQESKVSRVWRPITRAVVAQRMRGGAQGRQYLWRCMKKAPPGTRSRQPPPQAPDARCGGCVAQVATVFGRPKWDKIFKDIKKDHPGKRVGVFVCGPVVRDESARCLRGPIV